MSPAIPSKPVIDLRTRDAAAGGGQDSFDLDRVIWDPEYRRAVCQSLNRQDKPSSGAPPRLRRKAS